MRTTRRSTGIAVYPELHGKVCIVTGSSRGIGREIARILLLSGCKVVINGRDAERLSKTGEELSSWMLERSIDIRSRNDAGELLPITADVSTEAGAQLLISSTKEKFGQIDGLVNNAGISMRGFIGDLRLEAIEKLYPGNVLSAVLPTIAALPELERSRGKVVFVSTVAALWGFPGVSMYSATKAAVERFAQALDAETRRKGIRTTTVYLGFVENDPEKETLAADGSSFRHSRKAHQTQQQAAATIVRSLSRSGSRMIPLPAGRVFDCATRFFPRIVALLLARGKARVHTVTRKDADRK